MCKNVISRLFSFIERKFVKNYISLKRYFVARLLINIKYIPVKYIKVCCLFHFFISLTFYLIKFLYLSFRMARQLLLCFGGKSTIASYFKKTVTIYEQFVKKKWQENYTKFSSKAKFREYLNAEWQRIKGSEQELKRSIE